MSPNEEQLERIIRKYRRDVLPPKEEIVYDVGFLVGLVILLHEFIHEQTGTPYKKDSN
jgi:hypothetical protein